MLTLSYDLLLLGLRILFTLCDQQRPALRAPRSTEPTPSGPRPLKPRCPDDCPACRAHDQLPARPIPSPIYRLKTPSSRVAQVLSALAEGLDVAATARVFGHREATISIWLSRGGLHMQRLHARRLQGLHLPHVQLDEIRTRLRRHERVLWLWVALDPVSKLIPVLHLGGRTQDDAHQVVHQLQQQLAPGCCPLFSSDGLNHYFYALTAHFGSWVQLAGARKRQWQVAPDLIFGQVLKVVRRRKLIDVKQVMRLGTLQALRSKLAGLGFSGRLNTAFVARVNLSLRRGVAALARRTWATAQTAAGLVAQAELWRGYYHFCRPHEGLRLAR